MLLFIICIAIKGVQYCYPYELDSWYGIEIPLVFQYRWNMEQCTYSRLSSLNVKGKKAISWVTTDPNGVLRGSRSVRRTFKIHPERAGTRNLLCLDKIVTLFSLVDRPWFTRIGTMSLVSEQVAIEMRNIKMHSKQVSVNVSSLFISTKTKYF